MKSKSAILALLASSALALAGCGSHDQQSAATDSGIQPVSSDDLASAVPTQQPCSLDTIDGNTSAAIELAKEQPHTFRGWLSDESKKPAGDFSLVLTGPAIFEIAAKTGASRPDVAEGTGVPALADAGFEFTKELTSVPSGSYQVRFLISRGTNKYVCEATKTINLK